MPLLLIGARLFPCPICGEPLDVREDKRKKLYVICNDCGVQMFVRMQPGIKKFEKLIADAEQHDMWDRLRRLEGQYRRKCPKCGKVFWIDDSLIETSWFDGRVSGYRCPEPKCDGVAKLEEQK